MGKPLRILIADDHGLIRRGVRSLLAARPDWQVVGEAADGADVVDKATALRPDIVILDYSMPEMDGHAAATQILGKLPETGVVVLTMHDSEQMVRDLLRIGARGLVLKSDADRDLITAVEAVANKRHFFASSVAEMVLGAYLTGNLPRPRSTASPLTDREREVMKLLADGMTSKEAASELSISIRTVEAHRININRKLGFSSIADLVRYAIRTGIVAHA